MGMVLRIKSSDFSEFAGIRFNNPQNKELDEYINIFTSNSNLTAFQIEDDGQMNFDIVCYINNKLKNYEVKNEVKNIENVENKDQFRTAQKIDINSMEFGDGYFKFEHIDRSATILFCISEKQ